jgi:hypothetical protein
MFLRFLILHELVGFQLVMVLFVSQHLPILPCFFFLLLFQVICFVVQLNDPFWVLLIGFGVSCFDPTLELDLAFAFGAGRELDDDDNCIGGFGDLLGDFILNHVIRLSLFDTGSLDDADCCGGNNAGFDPLGIAGCAGVNLFFVFGCASDVSCFPFAVVVVNLSLRQQFHCVLGLLVLIVVDEFVPGFEHVVLLYFLHLLLNAVPLDLTRSLIDSDFLRDLHVVVITHSSMLKHVVPLFAHDVGSSLKIPYALNLLNVVFVLRNYEQY